MTHTRQRGCRVTSPDKYGVSLIECTRSFQILGDSILRLTVTLPGIVAGGGVEVGCPGVDCLAEPIRGVYAEAAVLGYDQRRTCRIETQACRCGETSCSLYRTMDMSDTSSPVSPCDNLACFKTLLQRSAVRKGMVCRRTQIVSSQSSFGTVGCLSSRGRDGQDHLPPPRSPINFQLQARKLVPPSLGSV